MFWKVDVPSKISEVIRSFRLTRHIMVELCHRIHNELPLAYPAFRTKCRAKHDERQCVWRIIIPDGEAIHFSPVAMDDSTAQGHLILTFIGHYVS
jgi:hypothetical protein